MLQNAGLDLEYDLLGDVLCEVARAFQVADHEQQGQNCLGVVRRFLDEIGRGGESFLEILI